MADKIQMQKKQKSITVRLTPESERILGEQNKKGSSTSVFINKLIQTGGNTKALHDCAVLIHMANLQSLLEGSNDPVLLEIRKELNELCRYLKS